MSWVFQVAMTEGFQQRTTCRHLWCYWHLLGDQAAILWSIFMKSILGLRVFLDTLVQPSSRKVVCGDGRAVSRRWAALHSERSFVRPSKSICSEPFGSVALGPPAMPPKKPCHFSINIRRWFGCVWFIKTTWQIGIDFWIFRCNSTDQNSKQFAYWGKSTAKLAAKLRETCDPSVWFFRSLTAYRRCPTHFAGMTCFRPLFVPLPRPALTKDLQMLIAPLNILPRG